MSYIRGGATYIWSDAWSVHLWSAEGYDGWDESSWYESNGVRGEAAGVAVRRDTLDEFVVMRLAELLEEGTLPLIIEMTTRQHAGNGGCEALIRQKERLLELLQESRP